ncbi:MAG: glycosyltransferase [Gemmatimonadota bacterium]|nr:glycosyltransferase [Gemmatimonadota bacterium]
MGTDICVVSNAYPDFEGSYHGIFVRRTVEDMGARGYFSRLLVPRIYSESARFEEHATHSVRRFRFPSAQKLLIEYERMPVLRLSVLLASGTIEAVRTIGRYGCRLVHAHWAAPSGLIALAASHLTGVPLVVTVHGSDYRLAAERGGPVGYLFKRVVRGAAGVIAVSDEIAAYVKEHAPVAPDRVTTCPMGADERIFNTSAAAEAELESVVGVVCTRNHLPLYRVDDLIQAAATVKNNIPNLCLALPGTGPQSGELGEQARALGFSNTEARFYGRIEPRRLASFLTAATVYVSTSPSEGTSTSLLEAMACGVLPVVTDIPSNRAWVTGGENGLLFPPGDVPALARALIRATTDKDLQVRARTLGPETVARRGGLWSHQIETLETLYRELIQE